MKDSLCTPWRATQIPIQTECIRTGTGLLTQPASTTVLTVLTSKHIQSIMQKRSSGIFAWSAFDIQEEWPVWVRMYKICRRGAIWRTILAGPPAGRSIPSSRIIAFKACFTIHDYVRQGSHWVRHCHWLWQVLSHREWFQIRAKWILYPSPQKTGIQNGSA